jgi:hypothetical protein
MKDFLDYVYGWQMAHPEFKTWAAFWNFVFRQVLKPSVPA